LNAHSGRYADALIGWNSAATAAAVAAAASVTSERRHCHQPPSE